MEIKKEVFVPIPSNECYYGVRVTKDTKLNYENEFVKQEVEDLVIHTVQTIKTEEIERVTDTKIFLKEGDIILLEEEARGWFKPVEGTRIGSIDDAFEELEFLKEQISKIKE